MLKLYSFAIYVTNVHIFSGEGNWEARFSINPKAADRSTDQTWSNVFQPESIWCMDKLR